MKIKLLAVALLFCLLFSSCEMTESSSGTETSADDTVETTIEETTEKQILENTTETETDSEEYQTYGLYEYETLPGNEAERLKTECVRIYQKDKNMETIAEEIGEKGKIVFYEGLEDKLHEYPEDTVFQLYVCFTASLPEDYHDQLYTDQQTNSTRTLKEWREIGTTYLIATEADYREHYIKYNKYFTEIGALTEGRCICFDGMYFYLYATLDQLLSYECAPDESLVVFGSPH